ncbi:hypothetical protein SDC9_211686 [bioreactor metagenome]|uniref:Uncharacterized protein n=1 Tax=bioreactor metagenome TaxID=1076179 RepID=A0A645JMF1_9ZZZZ
MVPQGQLVAAQLPGLGIEVAPAHPGAHVAGVVPGNVINDLKDVRFEYFQRNLKVFHIIQQQFPDLGMVSRIHADKLHLELKLAVPLQFLKQLCHQHGVLAPGDGHRSPVPRLNQLEVIQRLGKLGPDRLLIFPRNGCLDIPDLFPLFLGNQDLAPFPL